MQRSTNKRQREEIIRRQSASGRIVSGRSVSRKQRMKRARRKRRILIAVLCLLILAPVAAAGMFYQFHPVFLKNDVIVQELKEAFHPKALAGGWLMCMLWGFRRAMFANEAGLGTAPIAFSAVRTNNPVAQAFIAMLQPFVDTVIVGSATAFVTTD